MNSKPLNVFKAPLKGISLVEASAGTGKTYNITSLYVRALLEQDLEPSQVLVMTFMEAATAELKFRIRERLRESLNAIETQNANGDSFLAELISQNYENAVSKLKTAIDTFDECAVFTIHGFCNKILGEYSLYFDIPVNFEVLTDPTEILQECVDDYWRSFIHKADEDELSWFILDYLTDIGFGPDELRKTVEEVFKHPQSTVLPDNITTDQFAESLEQLETTFLQLKDTWKREKDIISDMYLNKKLSGRTFKEGKKWRQDWNNLLSLLDSEKPKIGVPERMERFGGYMKEKGSKKDFTVPDLNFFPLMDTYLELTNKLKFIKPAFIKESLAEIRIKFEEKKRAGNVLTYNDLLEITESGLEKDKSGDLARKLSKKYPTALVDEFQDTDPVQYGILKQIYYNRPETGLFMIGDPKQAIYGFRGADIFTYLTAKEDANKDQAYHLTENYRSHKNMIAGVNSLFTQNEDPFLLNKLSFNEVAPPSNKEEKKYIKSKLGGTTNSLQFIAMNENKYSNKGNIEADIYSILNNEITRLLSGECSLGGEPIRERDIAMLVRTGRQGEAIQDSLREIGISSVLRSRTSVFKTEEADELFKVLSSVQRISYEPGIRMALATSLLGYNAADLLQLNEQEREWTQIIEKLARVKHVWEEKGIESAIEVLFNLFEIRNRISKTKAAERKISNLLHLTELLTKTSREKRLNGKALLKWFFEKINADDNQASSEEEQLRLESDEGLIQITTIHSSKGLQYPIVFCPFLWSSKADPGKKDILKFNNEGENFIDISQVEEHAERIKYKELTKHQNQAEDVRLAYVALTRAVSACYVMFPKYNKIHESPISYILTGNNKDQKGNFDHLFKILTEADNIDVRNPIAARKENTFKDSDWHSEKLSAKEFKRHDLFNFPQILSYSSLSEGKEKADYEAGYDEVHLTPTNASELRVDRFGFPKGANAGTCLHQIFEDISFQDLGSLSKIVSDNLDYYGIDEKWNTVAHQWVKEVIKHKIDNSNTSLQVLSQDKVLKEMEFFFPVEHIKANVLWDKIRNDHPDTALQESIHGFMKGYIDLIFEKEGKFYILDYKSNYLGNSSDDYNENALKQAIKDSGYDLQYHIYTLALHRYLASRMKDYCYEDHFGGVYYLFLRGVVKDKPGSGVFYDCPDKDIIDQIDKYCSNGGI
ncbi:exodeoxyribonuclease V subunit beta [Gracilimonas sp.]|uniref:exodeoxyribonuclease V subunit beta n=1 Tax=Gracilimonas sp. TaxID=1974203 RepID=UPI002870E517|nr:exodeoxyribonuclease V subunit beta [Gracilimonas sp.]